MAGTKQPRFAFLEGVLRKYLRDRQRGVHAWNPDLLNQAADELNIEADDVLEY